MAGYLLVGILTALLSAGCSNSPPTHELQDPTQAILAAYRSRMPPPPAPIRLRETDVTHHWQRLEEYFLKRTSAPEVLVAPGSLDILMSAESLESSSIEEETFSELDGPLVYADRSTEQGGWLWSDPFTPRGIVIPDKIDTSPSWWMPNSQTFESMSSLDKRLAVAEFVARTMLRDLLGHDAKAFVVDLIRGAQRYKETFDEIRTGIKHRFYAALASASSNVIEAPAPAKKRTRRSNEKRSQGLRIRPNMKLARKSKFQLIFEPRIPLQYLDLRLEFTYERKLLGGDGQASLWLVILDRKF